MSSVIGLSGVLTLIVTGPGTPEAQGEGTLVRELSALLIGWRPESDR